ncbi:MAG: hypothetical protein AAGA54_22015 [Myxococcota bacterium]
MVFGSLLTLGAAALTGCGPSHEDTVAAKRACRLAEQYEAAAFGTETPTREQAQAQAQFVASVTGLSSGLTTGNTSVDKVVAEVSNACTGKEKVILEALNHHQTQGGDMGGLGEFVVTLEKTVGK